MRLLDEIMKDCLDQLQRGNYQVGERYPHRTAWEIAVRAALDEAVSQERAVAVEAENARLTAEVEQAQRRVDEYAAEASCGGYSYEPCLGQADDPCWEHTFTLERDAHLRAEKEVARLTAEVERLKTRIECDE